MLSKYETDVEDSVVSFRFPDTITSCSTTWLHVVQNDIVRLISFQIIFLCFNGIDKLYEHLQLHDKVWQA